MSNKKNSGLTRRASGLMALEPRFMFDGAALTDATQTLATADSGVKSVISSSLVQAEQIAKDKAVSFLNKASDQELFAIFNGGKDAPDAQWAERLAEIKQALGQSELPFEIRLMERASEFTAIAAFSARGPDGKPTIFINPYWASMLGNEDLSSVLIEEMGHWMDSVLNAGTDTPGDEGQTLADAVLGLETQVSRGDAADDRGWVTVDGLSYEVEFASLNFTNAYEMAYDWDTQNNTEDTTERWSSKEQNLHYFKTTSLGVVTISDGSGGTNFSGNDVSAIALNVGGNTFYGWISRPIKANGIVRGFYFWTDSRFTTLAAAQADGNQDGDSLVSNNRGFLLVVDQGWFTQQITNTGVSKTFTSTSKDVIDGYVTNGTTLTIANVGSSSDRVDSALNSVLPTNTAPVANLDLMTINEDSSGSGNLISGLVSTGTDGNAGAGADTDADAGTTLRISSFTVNGVTTNVIGTSGISYTIPNVGQITIASNGDYTFTPTSNYNGTVPDINYTVTDGVGGSASSYLRITVAAVNDAPTIVNDTNIAKEITTAASGFAQSGIIATGNILTNDSDPDGASTLRISGLNEFNILSNTDSSATYAAAVAKLYFESTTALSGSITASDNVAFYNGTTKYALYSSGVTQNNTTDVSIGSITSSTYVSGGTTYYRYEVKLDSSNLYYNGNNALTITAGMRFTFGNSIANAENSTNLLTAKETSNSPSLTFDVSTKGVTTSQVKIGDYITCSDLSGTYEITGITSTSGTVDTITVNTNSDITRNGSYDLTITGTSTTVLKYGSIKIDVKGNYTYTPNTDITNYQNGDLTRLFNAGAVDTESVQYTVTDGSTTSTETLTITVYGAGQYDAVASNVSNSVQEEGFDNSSPTPSALTDTNTTNNGVNSIVNATGDGIISGGINVTNDTYAKFNLKKATDASYAGSEIDWNDATKIKTVTGNYGVLTLYGDGTYTYTIDNTSSTIQALNYGETVYDNFNYFIHTFDNVGMTSNSNDGYTTRNISIAIYGANDAPTAYSNSNSVYDTPTSTNILAITGNVITQANASAQVDSDPDRTSTLTVKSALSSVGGASTVTVSGATTIQGLYGTLTLNPNGSYSYALDTTLAAYTSAIKPLKAGEQLGTNKEVFTYTIVDDYLKTSQSTLTIEIYGADQLPTIGVTGGQGEEGSSAVFTVDLIYPTGSNTAGVAVDLTFTNLTTSSGDLGATFEWSTDANFATVNGTGLSAGSVQTVTIPIGSSTIYVRRTTVDDNTYEGSETFVLNATFNDPALKYSNGSSGALRANVSSDGSWTLYDDGTATDGDDGNSTVDNDKPTLTIGDATVEEGSSLSFSASLSKASAFNEVITLSTSLGTAESNDFASDKSTWTVEYLDGASQLQVISVNSSGTFTLPSGVTAFTIKIPTTSDNVYEGLETLTLSANAASSYITDTDTAVGSITDNGSGTDGDDGDTTVDDDRPTLTVTGVNNVSEGSNAIFTVTLSKAAEASLLIDLALSDVTTQSGDYSATYKWSTSASGPWTMVTSNQISLAANTTTFYVMATTTADTPAVYEGAESFKLTASFNAAALKYVDGVSGTTRTGYTANANSTILDDGTGTIYNTDGTSTTVGADDDRVAPLSVTGGVYNEASPRAVFTISTSAGQSLTLDVLDAADTGKAPTGDGEGGANDSLNNAPIHYSLDGGLTWNTYNGTAIVAGSVPVLVAVDITAERDTVYEGEEQLKLVVTSGSQTASAYASILDDGTGSIQQPNEPNPDPDAPKDDDRPVRVNNIEVNENSPWAVFRVNGTAGQSVTLALQNDSDPNTANATLGTDAGTQLQYFNGTAWVNYTGAVTLPAGGELLVRVAINDDDPYEGPETFQLSATPSGGSAAYGTATILDDGTGSIYPDNTTGNPDPDAVKDDDRPVKVNNIRVNEASPYAVFTVTGIGTQGVVLSLQSDNDSTTANASLDVDTGNPQTSGRPLQYLNSSNNWVDYTPGSTVNLINGQLLVRTAIVNDAPYEGPEVFQLNVTPSGGSAVQGNATILDDGTGNIYPNNTTGNPDPDAVKNDDRPVRVNNIEINENSPWGVFRVNGTAGQSVTLALQNDNDPNTANALLGTDTGTQLQYFNGTSWVSYTGAVTLPAGGELLVRVAINDDTPYEGPETFQLSVTPSGGNAVYGTATILDDGTGSIYPDNTTGNPDPDAAKDDDRPVKVNNIEVNENSPWGVFRVNGTAGQSVTLALQNDSDPNTANAVLGTDTGTQLQYFNGTSWVNYTGAVTLPAEGELLVRVAINDDTPYEGPETFQLSVTPNGGTAVTGTATILDDGTGSIYPDNTTGNPDPDAPKDDDRPVKVNNIRVNEASPYAVFTVTGTGTQGVVLSLQNDNKLDTADAKLDVDTGNPQTSGRPLQYFNGSAWTDYTPGSTVNLINGQLLVRTAIVNDVPYEGAETFQLRAAPSSGIAAYGTATILDDGTGDIYPDNTSGATDPNAAKNDDRPVAAAPPPMPPAPPMGPPAPPAEVAPLPPLAAPLQSFASALTPLAPALVPADPPLAMVDTVTSGSGFQIPVSESAAPGLNLYQGITDQFVQTTDAMTKVSLPFDAFIHSNKDAVIKLDAKQADGSKLPAWVQFDPASGVFEVTPPKGFKGKLDLKVVARDDDGREAVAIFQMFVGEQSTTRPQSRDSFTEKLRMAGKRPMTLVRVSDLSHKVTARDTLRARAG
jgi:VCBS repeat-containing protein